MAALAGTHWRSTTSRDSQTQAERQYGRRELERRIGGGDRKIHQTLLRSGVDGMGWDGKGSEPVNVLWRGRGAESGVGAGWQRQTQLVMLAMALLPQLAPTTDDNSSDDDVELGCGEKGRLSPPSLSQRRACLPACLPVARSGVSHQAVRAACRRQLTIVLTRLRHCRPRQRRHRRHLQPQPQLPGPQHARQRPAQRRAPAAACGSAPRTGRRPRSWPPPSCAAP